MVGGGGVCVLSVSGVLDCNATERDWVSFKGFDIEREAGIASAAVGLRSVCAVAEGGALRCWSASKYVNEPGGPVPLEIHDAVTTARGDLGGYVIRKDGSLWSWGANDRGQRGLGGEAWMASDAPMRMGLLSPGAKAPEVVR